MKTHELIQSKFLKKEDCGDNGILAHIHSVVQDDVGTDDAPEQKWTLRFREKHIKPMVLNSTNIALIEKCHGDDTDNWIGKPVVLYNDANVSFGGRVVGGIRVDVNRTKRYMQKQPAQQPPAGFVQDGLVQRPAPQMPSIDLAPPQSAAGKPASSKFDDFEDDIPF